MSTFMNRKALVASALVLGWLSLAQLSGALAAGDHAEHAHLAAPAADKATTQHMGHAADAQKMDHAAMTKGSMADASMDHSKMAHDTKQHGHSANPAAADNHHDQ
ncbi:hypothetical protein FBY03_101347 [Pseudomonas sp. SJZ079]|nr:hypothetical protein FBY03_101347 [Pseudomonas sp. SJZ079]